MHLVCLICQSLSLDISQFRYSVFIINASDFVELNIILITIFTITSFLKNF